MNTISRDSWHFKLFRFFRIINNRFRHMEQWDIDVDLRNKTHVDLCTYVRTILVTGPLVLLFNIAVYGFLFYSLVIFPLMHYAVSYKYIGGLLIGLFFVGAIILTGLAIIWTMGWTKKKFKQGSFAHVLSERNRALKEQICPVFYVERTDDV